MEEREFWKDHFGYWIDNDTLMLDRPSLRSHDEPDPVLTELNPCLKKDLLV